MRGWLALLLAVLGSAEEDALRVRLADVPTLLAQARASAFAPLLDQQAHQAWREEIAAWQRRFEANSQSGVVEALAQARGVQFVLLDPEAGSEPRWALQADLGHHAPRFARGLGGLWLDAVPLTLAEADEAWEDGAGGTLARYAGIVAYGVPAAVLPLPPRPADAAVALDVAPAALARAVAVACGGPPPSLAEWSALAYRLDLAPDGLRWRLVVDGPTAGLLPADRTLLARLPASTIDATLLGIDGRVWWNAHAARLVTPAADRWLAGIGLPGGLRALVEACRGTVLVAIGPDLPLPSMLLALPRTPELDHLIAGVCAHLRVPLPGAEPRTLLLPDLPVAVMLGRDATHWLIGSDVQAVFGWGRGDASFAAAPAGRQLVQEAPAGACLLGAGEAARAVQALIGLAHFAEGLEEWQDSLPFTLLQRVLPALVALPPGRRWAMATDRRLELSGRGGDVLWGLAPAVATAALVPELLESRRTADERAVIRLLRAEIFPAQVQFQGGAYLDQDEDNVGEYGLLSELAGRRPVGTHAAGELRLLDGALRAGDLAYNHRFAVFVPDQAGAAIGELSGLAARPKPPPPAVAPEQDHRESYWVAYAWPATPEAGRWVFAVDATGQARRRPWDGRIPAWNDLYGGKGWETEPAWPLVPRPRR